MCTLMEVQYLYVVEESDELYWELYTGMLDTRTEWAGAM